MREGNEFRWSVLLTMDDPQVLCTPVKLDTDLCVHLCAFRDEAALRSRDGQFCSDLESGETYKSEVLTKAQKRRYPKSQNPWAIWIGLCPLRSENKENLNALR